MILVHGVGHFSKDINQKSIEFITNSVSSAGKQEFSLNPQLTY